MGLGGDEIKELAYVRKANDFRIVSIGRLLHLKGFHFVLKAFARVQHALPAGEYWVIGDGPERSRLERLARELDVIERVTFCGWLPRSQVLEKLAECDALVHPSLHDSGGWVCVEAMAVGRPVICLDLGGPALQVTEEAGFKVPAISPEQVVNDLAETICRLAQDPALRKRMGEAGQKRVAEYFDWDRKGERISKVYEKVCRLYRS